MNIAKSIVQLSLGAAFSAGIIVSRSDASPPHSDAAECDCPKGEAPIAGRVVGFDGTPQVIAAGAPGLASAHCMTGMQFLSGSCTGIDPTVLEDIQVQQFGFDKTTFAWFCAFKNNKATAVRVQASVLCLTPAT